MNNPRSSLDHLQQQWQKAANIVNDLAIRDRVIILAIVIALVIGIMHLASNLTLSKERLRLEKQLQQSQEKVAVIRKKAEAIERTIIAPEKTKEYKELQSLEKKTDNWSKEIDQFQGKAISQEKLIEILREGIDRQPDLNLISIKVPDPRILFATQRQQLLQQSVMISFTGHYFATLNYLKAINALKQPISWDELQYRVEKYPNAMITLRIHTLGYHEGKDDE